MKSFTKKKEMITLLVVIVFFIGCSVGGISSNEAKSLIEISEGLKPVKSYVRLFEGAYKKAKTLNMVDRYGISTSKTHNVFETVFNSWGSGGIYAKLKKELPIKIEITGIAESENNQGITEVLFTWTYPEVQFEIKRFLSNGGSGKAFLKKYNTGWRVEVVEREVSSEHISMSEKENIRDKNEIKEALAKQNLQEKLRRIKKQKAAERKKFLDELKKRSKISTRKISTSKFKATRIGEFDQEITVNDADIVFKAGWNNVNDINKIIPFVNIQEVYKRESSYPRKPAIELIIDYQMNRTLRFCSTNKRDKFFQLLKKVFKEWEEKFVGLKGPSVKENSKSK